MRKEYSTSVLQQDSVFITELLDKVKQQALQYLHHIDEIPTSNDSWKDDIENILPVDSAGAEYALGLFNNKYLSSIVASSGPRYLGFVIGGTTPASIMGDWLTSVYDQNSFATTGAGDRSALIELDTIQLLLQLFDLPKTFLGGFVSGATMSNFTCLAVARQWAGKMQQLDIAKDGVTKKIKVLSATPHSSSVKSLSMLGLGSANFIKLKTADGNREAVDITFLEETLQAFSNEPCIFISSGGTVNTVDFDDMQAIALLKTKYHFWWHIDAAFGAYAACTSTHKHLLNGWEYADSIAIDCHKWLNVPYDSAVFFVKDEHKMLQVETFQNSNAPYLGDPMADFTFMNFLPENSRRLRALPAWFSLMAYGKKGYADIVENNIRLAQLLGKLIDGHQAFEQMAPVRLNTVCFTLSNYKHSSHKIKLFLSLLNESGKVFMTPTLYNNSFGIRAAFVNWRSTEKDVQIIWNELLNALEAFDHSH